MGGQQFIVRLRDTVRRLSKVGTDVAEEQGEDKTNMSTSMASNLSISHPIPVSFTAGLRPNRRRHITVEAGHALEKLGHAIEYLADEFVLDGGEVSSKNGQVEAVQLLMRMNRQVYFECPEVPTIGERLRAMLHIHAGYKSSENHRLRI
jgi:hypothetical protein